jgi:hypothetical protein
MMSDDFTSDTKKQVAAGQLKAIFDAAPARIDSCLFDLEAGPGFAANWIQGGGILTVQVSYELDLGRGEEDEPTKALAMKPEPCALMRVMVTCNSDHPAFKFLRFAVVTKSNIVLEPIMTAACQVAKLSVSEESRDIMFPPDDVQEMMYVGYHERELPLANHIALAFYVVVPVTNAALIALKNKAANFLKSYLHIAAAHRIGPMAATLEPYRLKKG